MHSAATLAPLTAALLQRFEDSDQGLTATIDLAVLVAMADGRIDPAEMSALQATVDALVGAHLVPAVSKHLVTESREKNRRSGPEARAREVGVALARRFAGEEGIRLALAIAWTSEGVCAEERAVIDVVAAAAGVAPARVDAILAELAPPAS